MSQAEVRAILGQPDDTADQVSEKGRIELWLYASRIMKSNRVEAGGVIAAFKNGKVAQVNRR